MRSSITHLLDYRQIPVPVERLQIEIPDWETVARPMVTHAQREYEQQSGEYISHLTDEMVQSLDLPEMYTVHQLKQYGMDMYARTQKEKRFYEDVLPFVISYLIENSAMVLNSDEVDDYIEEAVEIADSTAEEQGQSLAEYLNIPDLDEESAVDHLIEQSREAFIFDLIAQEYYRMQGLELDEAAYEAFIQQQVVHQQVDAIQLRADLSYGDFQIKIPKMVLLEDLFNYFTQNMEFIINPNLTLEEV